jgi:hypothetical protein
MEALQTKGGFHLYLFWSGLKNCAKRVNVAQRTVPFGTVEIRCRRRASLRKWLLGGDVAKRLECVRFTAALHHEGLLALEIHALRL